MVDVKRVKPLAVKNLYNNLYRGQYRMIQRKINTKRALEYRGLKNAFYWDLTPEGHKYWSDIYNKLEECG